MRERVPQEQGVDRTPALVCPTHGEVHPGDIGYDSQPPYPAFHKNCGAFLLSPGGVDEGGRLQDDLDFLSDDARKEPVYEPPSGRPWAAPQGSDVDETVRGVHFTREDVEQREALIGFEAYRKKAATRAVRIIGPFSVETREGLLTCRDGWLAVDTHGWPYPIAADEFERIYEAHETPVPSPAGSGAEPEEGAR